MLSIYHVWLLPCGYISPSALAFLHHLRQLVSNTSRIAWVWHLSPLSIYDSHDTRFPKMWYVRPAKAQTSLRIRTDWSEPLLSLKYSMTVKLLTEHHLEFLSLKGGWTGSSESTLVKMPHYWKSHVTAQLLSFLVMLISTNALLLLITRVLIYVFVISFSETSFPQTHS